MPERYERVHVGWHCAKVKGHAELTIEKPRVKTLSYDFPKLHHSNPSSFCDNVHLRQIGCHFESVSQTELVVELNLALSEKRPTTECRSNSGIFYRIIVLMSQVATFVPRQRCQVT